MTDFPRRAEVTESGHWRCLRNCTSCGYSVEAWGRTEHEAKKNAVAKLDLHKYDQHAMKEPRDHSRFL